MSFRLYKKLFRNIEQEYTNIQNTVQEEVLAREINN